MSAVEHPARPFIIPVFIPHSGCSHRCVFCNQHTITGVQSPIPSSAQLDHILHEFLSYRRPDRQPPQLAFYGGNFLGLDPADIRRLLETTGKFITRGDIIGIRFSTRPDTVNPDTLRLLTQTPVTAVELGVQSMDDEVLAYAQRGHTAADTIRAVALLKQHGYTIGLQAMVGLPGDTAKSALAGAGRMAALKPDFVRIYPTLVIAGSRLAHMYRQGDYQPMSLEAAVWQVKRIYLLLRSRRIDVIRMGLQATAELDRGSNVIAGPYHPAFGQLVHSAVFLDRAADVLLKAGANGRGFTLAVHPRNISNLRGQKNGNLAILGARFGISVIGVVADPALSVDEVALMQGSQVKDR